VCRAHKCLLGPHATVAVIPSPSLITFYLEPSKHCLPEPDVSGSWITPKQQLQCTGNGTHGVWLSLLSQELRWRRDQLANELQLRQQQLQRLEGRHQELEMQLEVQRQQLINELQVLAQLQQQQAQQQAQQPAPEEQPQHPQQQPEQEQQQQQQHEAPQHLQHSQQVEGPQQELHRGQHSAQCPQHKHEASLAGLQQRSDRQHPPLCRPEAAPAHQMAEDSARHLDVQQQVVDQAPTLGNSSGTSHDRDADRDGDAGCRSAAAGRPSHQQHGAATTHRAAEHASVDGAAGSNSGGTGPSRQLQPVPQAGPEQQQQQQQQPRLGLRWRFRRRV